MDKRRLHHMWTLVRVVKPWYFLILAVVSLIVSGFALRANNLEMVRLRNAVYSADKNNGDVETALRQLRDYVGQHMNTNLASGTNAVHPPIQLKYTYERLNNSQGGNPNPAQVYTDAQHYCEQTIPDGFSGSYRLACVQTYVEQHKASNDPSKKTDIPKNLYQFDFASPHWSPDLAGWSLVATAFFGLCFIVSLITRPFIKHAVK